MAILLSDFKKTIFSGLYKSKEKTIDGYKYICRFQKQNKKYVKVLGFSKKDNLDEHKAYELFLAYKQEIIQKLENKQQEKQTTPSFDDKELIKIAHKYKNLLGSTDKVALALKKMHHRQKLAPYQEELIKLQTYLELKNKKMIVLFEGRDASGKGGAIRTISRYMNSKKYRIVALGKPTNTERHQWYFQRYIKHFPSDGEIVMFDRSWYNRSMVEPVFDFCTPKEYENFFVDIKPFEQSIVRNNTILVKLYYSVSKSMQAIRFDSRSKDPLRQWKLSEIDLQAQDLWDEFTQKKYKMIKDSEIPQAPWHIIRSDNKYITRLESIKAILNCVDYSNKNTSLDYSFDKRYVYNAQEELAFMRKHNE